MMYAEKRFVEEIVALTRTKKVLKEPLIPAEVNKFNQVRNPSEALSGKKAADYKKVYHLGRKLSECRMKIVDVVERMSEDLARPTNKSWEFARCLGRFLNAYPSGGISFDFKDEKTTLGAEA